MEILTNIPKISDIQRICKNFSKIRDACKCFVWGRTNVSSTDSRTPPLPLPHHNYVSISRTHTCKWLQRVTNELWRNFVTEGHRAVRVITNGVATQWFGETLMKARPWVAVLAMRVDRDMHPDALLREFSVLQQHVVVPLPTRSQQCHYHCTALTYPLLWHNRLSHQMWCPLINNLKLTSAWRVLKFNGQNGQLRPPSAVSAVILPMIRYCMLLTSEYGCSKWRPPRTNVVKAENLNSVSLFIKILYYPTDAQIYNS